MSVGKKEKHCNTGALQERGSLLSAIWDVGKKDEIDSGKA